MLLVNHEFILPVRFIGARSRRGLAAKDNWLRICVKNSVREKIPSIRNIRESNRIEWIETWRLLAENKADNSIEKK